MSTTRIEHPDTHKERKPKHEDNTKSIEDEDDDGGPETDNEMEMGRSLERSSGRTTPKAMQEKTTSEISSATSSKITQCLNETFPHVEIKETGKISYCLSTMPLLS